MAASSEVILKTLRKPDGEPRLAAFHLLAAIAALPPQWCVKSIASGSDLGPYLLDRSTERDKVSKEWKFGVIAALARNANLEKSLGAFFCGLITTHFQQGPFFVEKVAGPAKVAVGERSL